MDRPFFMSYRSVVLSCLLTGAVLADIPCQDGITYKNSCNPYKVNFIHLKKIKKSEFAQEETQEQSKKKSLFSRSYLNNLIEKFSSNYDGRSGLQALIDRSHYGRSFKGEEAPTDIKVASKDSNKELDESIESKTTTELKESQDVVATTQAPNKKEPVDNVNEIKSKALPKKEHIVKKEVAKKDIIAKSTTRKVQKESNQKAQKKKVAQKKKKAIKLATYTIKKGDSLSKLASILGISVKELKEINGIKKDATIKFGQKLKYPARLAKKFKAYELKIKKEKELLAKKRKIQEQIKKGFYIVQKGDTLSTIAKKTKLSISQLRELNQIAKSSHIRVGQKLLLKTELVMKKRRKDFINYVRNIKFKKAPQLKFKRKIRVIATAYTSHRNQTDSTPFLAAWNNRIRPGMKIIAVSEDLIRKYGLTNGVKVKITGLPGYYVVRDKMNKRLRNHIDIYMGLNKRKALRWGRRRVALYW